MATKATAWCDMRDHDAPTDGPIKRVLLAIEPWMLLACALISAVTALWPR